MMTARPNTIRAVDGADLHVSCWGDGPPVLLAHAWAMSGRMWDYQIPALGGAGRSCIVPDRRGHGRSGHIDTGYDLDTLADDLAAVIDSLDLRDLTLVGHSMGAQEILRYLSRHGSRRVAGVVLSAPTTPCVLQRADFPSGVPEEVFEAVRTMWLTDFGSWVRDNTDGYFGRGSVSEPLIDMTTRMMMDTPLPVIVETHRTLTRADLRPDVEHLDVPTTIIHGTDDLSAPIDATGRLTASLISGAHLSVIEGGGHGMYHGHCDAYNDALLEAILRR